MKKHQTEKTGKMTAPATRQPFDFSKLKALWAAREEEVRAASARLLAEARIRAAPVLRRFGAERALVFGSVADGRAREDSDLDLLVLGTDPWNFWSLRRELEEALERPLDLYTEADDPVFVARARKRGTTIYER